MVEKHFLEIIKYSKKYNILLNNSYELQFQRHSLSEIKRILELEILSNIILTEALKG